MRRFVLILFFLLLMVPFGGRAQQYSTKNKKAIKLYEQASASFRLRDYETGMNLLLQAVQKDPAFVEAHMSLAHNFQLFGYLPKALEHYEAAVKADPKSPKVVGAYYTLATEYLKQGRYREAKEYALRFLSFHPEPNNFTNDIERVVASAEFALEAMQQPLPFEPKPLPGKVNREDYLQYFPVLTADEEMLIFTARRKEQGRDEDILVSYRQEDGSWGEPQPLSPVINTAASEGTCAISADGTVLVFTSCQSRRGYGSCDLFVSYRYGNEWSTPVNLGANVNSSSWESQPTLSPDGRVLFFVSDRPGGMGERDIYMTMRDEDGRWLPAVNVGAPINTYADEVSPFLYANGKRLFFASNGHVGMGDFDLYYSDWHRGRWSEPVNLGYPLNDHQSQVSLFVTADGKKGYYAQEQWEGRRQLSAILMYFDMPPQLIPAEQTAYVKGVVRDARTGKPLKAEIELFNVNEDSLIAQVWSDTLTGEYLIVLNQGADYALEVNKAGYLMKSLSFRLKETNDTLRPVILDIELEPITAGSKFVLSNIFFDYGKYTLREESKAELRKVVEFMQQNPSVTAEIAGHTDDIGEEKANMELSLRRAKAVYDYLIAAGIEPRRLSYKGYGETQPAVPNTSDANRAQNRRIEFRIISVEKTGE
ncbi:MAG: cell envelope biogenesis protein OmpA [Thermonema sp.]|uniref:OmpA family protein n=1 Tax=Thermonema sp. TaxID=2231181 RepID=UPI0021DF0715|nr:OmpA family protein [Thermonema sp.]GIV38999.1 MAG: cell envelope biogenesis protein OmpA [Thermonema sp.]